MNIITDFANNMKQKGTGHGLTWGLLFALTHVNGLLDSLVLHVALFSHDIFFSVPKNFNHHQ